MSERPIDIPMTAPTPDRLTKALLSYRGPLDVSLPVHPSVATVLRPNVEALADHLTAALATRPEPGDLEARIRAAIISLLDEGYEVTVGYTEREVIDYIDIGGTGVGDANMIDGLAAALADRLREAR